MVLSPNVHALVAQMNGGGDDPIGNLQEKMVVESGFALSYHSPKNKSRPTTVVVETGVETSGTLSRSPSNSEREEKRRERSIQIKNKNTTKREEEKKEMENENEE